MKNRIRVVVLFKSGVEKTFYSDTTNEKIDTSEFENFFKKVFNDNVDGQFTFEGTVMRISSIDAVTIEVEKVED